MKLFQIQLLTLFSFSSLLFFLQCTSSSNAPLLNIQKDTHISIIGNNLCSRMMNYGFFETEAQLRFPDSLLYIRNFCDGGNTPGFRPHSGLNEPWAFPGAEKFQTELANKSGSTGHFETPDEWLTRHQTDIILGFFGFSESFEGPAGIPFYKAELDAFIKHTLNQKYNGKNVPQLVLVSPIAFQDLTAQMDVPSGNKENGNLRLYTAPMSEVAAANGVPFINVFEASMTWFSAGQPLTIDGSQMNEAGYDKFSSFLATKLFGKIADNKLENRDAVLAAVQEKNWFWHNDFKIPNGVHVFGRRYDPFGPDNYPAELKKIREMTDIRDQAIWAALQGQPFDLEKEDQKTTTLPEVETNYFALGNDDDIGYLYGDEALSKFKMAKGYEIELFASEKEFPDLANPVQISFDNKGRLWVGCMPSYPHYKPGDSKPNDKLIILEDTDNDGKADKQTTFADGLHLTIGFEFAPEGVYVSQGTNLILISDTDGDDRADTKEIILSGFDDHDTHHAISAFCADPSGAIFMGEGVFLHTNVETSYGTVRATNGGFYRYSPQRHHLERNTQVSIPNPWGIAVDEWGQNLFAETSGPKMEWMMPASIKSTYGIGSPRSPNLIEEKHLVRPTSGLEFVSSRHFPDEVQGDFLINNDIGFLGTKMHSLVDAGTGYESKHRLDLVVGSDPNFRPVDMEFAPDGSLYLIDWHNVLIGHMQHNARDPLRDHVHGRVYRIIYPARPLVTPAKVDGATIEELLENLKLPEHRTRYRTRRELRARNADEVLASLSKWVAQLDKNDPRYEHHVLEALWVTWGLNKIDQTLINQLMQAKDFRARAAAVRVVRYGGHQLDNQVELLTQAAADPHGRVRLEAIVAASWLNKKDGIKVISEAGKHELDDWMARSFAASLARLNGNAASPDLVPTDEIKSHLKGDDLAQYVKGLEVYQRDGYCNTCHQANGKGLEASGFPPLAGTEWVLGNEERLIKLTLRGVYGPMEVNGVAFPGQVPMTPFGGLLKDEELAAVLTYVRNSFGNQASVISTEQVKKVRASIEDKKGYYSPQELLELHPMEIIVE